MNGKARILTGAGELVNAINAGYAFFYAHTYEMTDTVEQIQKAILELKQFKVSLFDYEENQDAEGALAAFENQGPDSILIAKNFHWFLKDEVGAPNKMVCSWIQNRLEAFTTAENYRALIIVSDDEYSKAIPEMLGKDFLQIEFPLPDVEAIEKIYDYIVDSAKDDPKFKMPDEQTKRDVIDSSRGMTKREITCAYAYSIVRDKGNLNPKTVGEIQAKEIAKTDGLSLLDCSNVGELIGYETLKEVVLGTIYSPLSKGVLLLGPAGTGKTHFCMWVGKKVNRKVIKVELAQMMGEGLVGQAEKAVGKACQVLAANAPCIVIVDEIEKGLAGVGNNSMGNETKRAAMAQFLKFLSDERPDGIYIMATCNNMSMLPPEWVRAERWDCAPFFIDLPTAQERDSILEHYKKVGFKVGKETLKPTGDRPENMADWTGAEIKSVCRLSVAWQKTIEEVQDLIIPIARTMDAEISSLKKWAEGRTIPATKKISMKPVSSVGDKRRMKISMN